MKNLERLFAEKLLKIKAIKLQPANPFTWASGWKSPFYCDNRKTLSYPSLRNFVKIEITRLILERFGQVDAIAGVATGAIPQGALVADALNLPFVYVRSTPKDHGLENLIEGELRPGMKVVVVEDLISTGGSSLKAVNLPADTPKGYVLVTYRQVPIGWEKNIGNRANNLYPQEWKIKSSHGTGELFIVNSLQQE